MEETAYDRPKNNSRSTVNTSDTNATDAEGSDPEKKTAEVQATNQDVENGQSYSKKTYWQKLSVWPQSRPNRLLRTMSAPLRFFSYPIVVYAGLMYGANGLVWSSILNSTAGTLYPRVYGFSTSGIALAYLGGVVGVIVG